MYVKIEYILLYLLFLNYGRWSVLTILVVTIRIMIVYWLTIISGIENNLITFRWA